MLQPIIERWHALAAQKPRPKQNYEVLALYLKCSGQEAKKCETAVQAQLSTPDIGCSKYCVEQARKLARGDVVESVPEAQPRAEYCTVDQSDLDYLVEWITSHAACTVLKMDKRQQMRGQMLGLETSTGALWKMY